MSNDGNKPVATTEELPPAVAEIRILLLKGGKVVVTMPTDMKVTCYMLGEFFKQIGPTLEYKEPSPIIQPPSGLRIPTKG